MKTSVRPCVALFAGLGLVLVAACGRTTAEVAEAPPVVESRSPSPSPFVALADACTQAAPAEAYTRAKKYCSCIYKAAAERWTYEYYAAHVERCERELESEVGERCDREASQ